MAVMDIIVRAQDRASQELSDIDREVDEIGRSAEETGGKLRSNLSADKIGGFGKAMTTRVTLPLLLAGGAAFKMGSDLNEAISQAGVVFGDESQKVITASENMNDAFGQADFLASASNIGDVAQGLGIARDEADDMALSVLGLSQDLSSFKNVPVEQATNAITSALTGERESLKSLGIVLKDTDVKQKALEMGLWDGEEALSSSAQAQATYALITEKSENAIGDFDRTSEGAANKTRILKANALDMAAGLGTKLLPIGQRILSWLDGMVTWFTDIPGPMQNVILAILGLVAAIGPMLIIGAKLVKAFQVISVAFKALNLAFMANPWFLLIAATIALVVLIIANWDKILAFLKAAWEWIKGAAQAVADFFIGVWEAVTEKTLEIWNAIIDFFKALPGNIMSAIRSLATTVLNFILKYHPVAIIWRKVLEIWPAVRDWFSALPGRIVSGIAGLASTVFNFIRDHHPVAILFRKAKEFWPDVLTWFKDLPGRILRGLGNLGSILFEAGKDIIRGLWDGLKNMWSNVTGWVSGLGNTIANLKGPAEVDARLLTNNGQLIMGGLLEGLQRDWPRVRAFMAGRGSDLESAFGTPTVGANGTGAMGVGSAVGATSALTDLLREQNMLLRAILMKTGFSIDGRDLVDAIGGPLVSEIRQRTGA